MEKVANRIIVLAAVIVFFVVLYSAVGADMGDKSVKFGYWVNNDTEDECENFVVLGTDMDETRTDLILFCQYFSEANSLKVLQIPRDTRVETVRSDKKINSAYGSKGGIECVKNEVESVVGIYPENYVVLNFKGFKELVDAIGGIEFDVPMAMYYTDPKQQLVIDLKPGKQLLNGEKAEMFMRFRQNNDGSGYPDGDVGRVKAQYKFYEAAVEKIVSRDGIMNMQSLAKVAEENLKTDFTVSDLLEHIDKIKNINPNSVEIFMLPGYGKYVNENGREISYYLYDEEKTKDIVNKHFKL